MLLFSGLFIEVVDYTFLLIQSKNTGLLDRVQRYFRIRYGIQR